MHYDSQVRRQQTGQDAAAAAAAVWVVVVADVLNDVNCATLNE